MVSLKQWLIQHGDSLGNALSSGIGLAFAISANYAKTKTSDKSKSKTESEKVDEDFSESDLKYIRKCWIILWSSLLGMYLGWAIPHLFAPKSVAEPIAIHPWAIFHSIATSATVMLWMVISGRFTNRNGGNAKSQPEKHWGKISINILLFFVFFITISNSYLDYWFNEKNQIIKIVGGLIPFTLFLLLSWSYREKHMQTALIFLAYAYLQLPTSLLGKFSWESDFLALIVSKLGLIGAMYKTLRIKDKLD